jgi:hypothetical protein
VPFRNLDRLYLLEDRSSDRPGLYACDLAVPLRGDRSLEAQGRVRPLSRAIRLMGALHHQVVTPIL